MSRKLYSWYPMVKAKSFRNLAPSKYPISGEGWVNYRGGTCELMIDPGIARYYRKLIPQYHNINAPRWSPHITIVREFEKRNNNFGELWYYGYYFPFYYSPKIHFDGTYFYLRCVSKWITKMRKEFGLEPYRFDNCYHITIGNCK